MDSKFAVVRNIVLAAMVAAGTSGGVRADDNSMSIWTGDSYAAFNGGRMFPCGMPVLDNARSAFRQHNPQGLSEREYQALSKDDLIWQIPNPAAAANLAATDAATSWRQAHPYGLSNREYQALSNGGPVWRLTPAESNAIAAGENPDKPSAAANDSLRERIARFLQRTPP